MPSAHLAVLWVAVGSVRADRHGNIVQSYCFAWNIPISTPDRIALAGRGAHYEKAANQRGAFFILLDSAGTLTGKPRLHFFNDTNDTIVLLLVLGSGMCLDALQIE